MVTLPSLKPFIRKLDRLLTAMAYAEAGDLDAVKALLEQDSAPAQAPTAAAPEIRLCRGVEGAKILEFKRAKPAL